MGRWKLDYFTDYDMNSDRIIDGIPKISKAENKTSKPGICQNDHGGPLISWVKGKETVLGVASVFRVNQNLECVPPFLFTSTYRNKNLIECLVNQRSTHRCLQLKEEENYKVISRRIYWNEQSNSASRETIVTRSQISLSLLQR